MDTDVERPLRFGSFELDLRSRELRKGTARVRLQDQPFEILRLMLEHPGHVVTRDELRQRLWPEGTFVDFEHSLNAAVKRLRAALGDDADNPRYVETLPRRGYRFIGAVDEEGAPEVVASGTQRVRMAVLPFTCLGGEQGQEYFTDGLTEEMIAQLGRLCRGRIGVIARQSSMAFKGTTRGAREIGHALRAAYLLEGSVRREGDRVRITARLVETSGETNLWVETYERHLTDFLSVQAEVAARIAQSLAMELVPEQPRPGIDVRSPDAAAYQAYLKARYFWNKPGDEGVGDSLVYFQQAIGADPSYAAAYSGLARAYVSRAEYYRERPAGCAREGARRGGTGAAAGPGLVRSAPGGRRSAADAAVGRASRAVGVFAGDRAQPELRDRAPCVRDDADGARSSRAGHSRIGPRVRARSALPGGQHDRSVGALRGGRLRRRDRAVPAHHGDGRPFLPGCAPAAGRRAPAARARTRRRCRRSRRRARPARSIRWRWPG